MDRSVCLLVNPSAGAGRAEHAAPAVQATLAAAGLHVDAHAVRSLDEARRLAEAATRRRQLVAVLAGDGMIGAVADALRLMEDALLAVLPAGRGNDFARALRIPLDPVAACEPIIAGHRARIDLGAVEARAFVGIATVGFDSIATEIANKAPPQLGRLVYAYGALRALAHWRPARFDVQLEGGECDSGHATADERAHAPDLRRRSFAGYTVAAASTCFYGGGMRIAPHASNRDRMLDVVTISQMSRARFLLNLPRVFYGSHVRLSSVSVERASAVHIDADRPLTVYADGEPVGPLPVRISVLPAAIDVIVPKDAWRSSPTPPATARRADVGAEPASGASGKL